MVAIDFNNIPSGIQPTQERIDELHRRAIETGQAFARRLATLMETFGEARDRYSREADSLVASASDPETRRAAQQLAKQRLAQQVLDYRHTLAKSSEWERADMLRQLKGFADEAEQLAQLHASPAQFLGRLALGDSRRLNVQLTLAEAGPLELEAAARLAIITGDLPMAAAIVTVVDRRPRDRRPFSVGDFATRVLGDKYTEIAKKLAEVQLAFKTAFAAEREFVRGKPDPLTNISLAVARRGLAASAASQTEEA